MEQNLAPGPLDQLESNISSSIQGDPFHSQTQSQKTITDGKPRRQRQKWTQEETDDLIKGCGIHGVGNWKKILQDPTLKFNNRTSVDLKDRFRTYFPEDYKRLYPNATSTRERATAQPLSAEAASFLKAKRKDRTPFSKEEDASLLIGFGKYGGKWSAIQKDETLGLNHRRSTDLRDRFRNAFPDKYVGAGFKPPPPKRRRRTLEDSDIAGNTDSAVNATQPPSQAPFEFRTDEQTPASIRGQEADVTTSVRREPLATAISTSQPTSTETFSNARLAWSNANVQKEMEMAMKLRRALDMSNASEMMGDTEIPLDPGLSDVAYQPHGGPNQDTEALTGLLDAAVHHGTWKGK